MKKITLLMTLLLTTSLFSGGDNDNYYNSHPSEVVEKIIKDAEREWPNEYSMQRWQIERELKEYAKVIEYKKLSAVLKKEYNNEKGN